jgi:hypothetical protein
MALYTHSFFSFFGLQRLREQRGARWNDLVDRLNHLSVADPQVMAFSLTVRRLRRTLHIEHACTDGLCARCAADVIAHYPGSEQDLLDLYHHNLHDMRLTLASMPQRERTHELAQGIRVA